MLSNDDVSPACPWTHKSIYLYLSQVSGNAASQVFVLPRLVFAPFPHTSDHHTAADEATLQQVLPAPRLNCGKPRSRNRLCFCFQSPVPQQQQRRSVHSDKMQVHVVTFDPVRFRLCIWERSSGLPFSVSLSRSLPPRGVYKHRFNAPGAARLTHYPNVSCVNDQQCAYHHILAG